MLTIKEIQEVLDAIEYRDWELVLRFNNDDRAHPYLQWKFVAPDAETGLNEWQSSRKWQLSFHMTRQEVERTAYLAVEQAVLHELAEEYTYKGVALRNPHVDPDALVEIIEAGRITARDPMPTAARKPLTAEDMGDWLK